MKNTPLKVFLGFVLVLLLTYVGAYHFGAFYSYLFPHIVVGSFLNFSGEEADYIEGIPLAYLFFVSLVVMVLSSVRWRYILLGALLLPVLLVEVYADFGHVYFPLIIILVGAILGWGLSKLVEVLMKGFRK